MLIILLETINIANVLNLIKRKIKIQTEPQSGTIIYFVLNKKFAQSETK